MLGRLIRKELLHHLLDFRFLAIFTLCTLLSALSIYVGTQNYHQQLRGYNAVSEANRRFMYQSLVKDGNLWDLRLRGYPWNRKPEVLSPVVFGLSGQLGRETHIQYQNLVLFKDSLSAVDPVYALFDILDFAFIVKVVLSFCALLLIYDAICGEKEAGTLRLYSSFPVPRATMALAKLIGSTVAVLVPFGFAFLLATTVLALSPGLGLQGEDWQRMAILMGVFSVYITVLAAFGLWVSALTQRRVTAFLGLLGLWTGWVFILPNVALLAARNLVPVESIYAVQKQGDEIRWEIRQKRETEVGAYWQKNPVKDWNALSKERQTELLEGLSKIRKGWDAEYYNRLKGLQAERRNRMQRQQGLTMALSSLSPLSAVSFASMDLARTGLAQQERIENALNAYLVYMSQYIQDKEAIRGSDRVLSDFVWFTYQDNESLGECLSRNALHILNLALLAVLGFAGAYVAILRYDVR